jgi:hypothetical protein
MTRTVGTAALLAVGTVLLWWVVFPSDWSVVPTADPQSFTTPISAGHWAVAAVGLAMLAAVGGYVRGPAAALLGVALPAIALYGFHSATAEVIGANLWIVGALLLAPVLAGGVAIAAALGRLTRRRRTRP